MLKDRLKALFKSYDPVVRQVIYEVGEIEQQYISMEKPRGIMKDIDEIITRIAKEELEKVSKKEDSSS
ncbi:MAG: hypothetical protein IPG51_04945 [Chloroflexi bacterium]|nr:hypothetical protein [Chloroflexota bacterium]MBK8932811.1 hypothetical protein [Chloroflexota bacterium]